MAGNIKSTNRREISGHKQGTLVERSYSTGSFISTKLKDTPFSYRAAQKGVPADTVRSAELGISREDIRMIIPDRTLDRRIADGALLKVDEADGIARLLRVLHHARRVFGNDELADEWLHTANPALGDEIPMRMARTDLGGREVEAVLGRMEHGVFG